MSSTSVQIFLKVNFNDFRNNPSDYSERFLSTEKNKRNKGPVLKKRGKGEEKEEVGKTIFTTPLYHIIIIIFTLSPALALSLACYYDNFKTIINATHNSFFFRF